MKFAPGVLWRPISCCPARISWRNGRLCVPGHGGLSDWLSRGSSGCCWGFKGGFDGFGGSLFLKGLSCCHLVYKGSFDGSGDKLMTLIVIKRF